MSNRLSMEFKSLQLKFRMVSDYWTRSIVLTVLWFQIFVAPQLLHYRIELASCRQKWIIWKTLKLIAIIFSFLQAPSMFCEFIHIQWKWTLWEFTEEWWAFYLLCTLKFRFIQNSGEENTSIKRGARLLVLDSGAGNTISGRCTFIWITRREGEKKTVICNKLFENTKIPEHCKIIFTLLINHTKKTWWCPKEVRKPHHNIFSRQTEKQTC